MTFINSLLETFGVGMGTFLTYACVGTMGVIVIYNYKFFWKFIVAIGDGIVAQLSKIPIFANGTYLTKIRKMKSAIRDMRDLQKELEGQKEELLTDYHNNQVSIDEAIQRAQYLKQCGNKIEALPYAKKALSLQDQNKKIWEEDIPNLEAASEAAEKKIADMTDAIDTLKREKKSLNRDRRTAEVLEKSNNTLIGDGTDADDQILEYHKEYIQGKRSKAIGSEAVLAKLPERKLRTLDDKILSKQAEEFLETL